jgi:hypothetical protein
VDGEAGQWQLDWQRYKIESEDAPLKLDHSERLLGA